MTQRNKPRNAAVFGIDLGKNVFHVVGLDATGVPIQRATFRRETLLQFFERATRSLVGMEACPGSQWLARKLTALGHTVRIVPAKFVKPYVKSNKSDIIDAEAIAEAVSRPTMRFVEIRSPDQVDLQALHRVRDRLVAQRTRVICQMRAFCLEYGIAMHDIVIDPLAMPIGADTGTSVTTFETLRRIRDEFGLNMTCGASNVSFGMPERHALNATWLPMAMTHGLTCAIMDTRTPQIVEAVKAADVFRTGS